MYRLLTGFVVALACLGLAAPPVHAQEKPADFYGKPVSLVKVFGQRSRGEAAAGAPSPQDSEAEALPAQENHEPGPDALHATDLGTVEDVLRELYACRAALAALRALPDPAEA